MLKGHLANGAKISLVFFCKISKNIGIPSLKRRQKAVLSGWRRTGYEKIISAFCGAVVCPGCFCRINHYQKYNENGSLFPGAVCSV